MTILYGHVNIRTDKVFLSDVRTLPILRICAITQMNTQLRFYSQVYEFELA